MNRRDLVIAIRTMFIVTASVLSSRGYAQAEDGRLLFRSGFEPNVYVTRDYRDIRGADGMDWQRDLEQRVPYADRLIDYVRNDGGHIQVYFDDTEYWSGFPAGILSQQANR